jgi:hypothetical protein
VLTPVGVVTVLGTEFSVELRPGQQQGGGATMQGRTIAAMAVAVAFGSVEVDVGGRTYTLLGGQSQVYAKDGEGGGQPRARSVGGVVESVAGSTLTLAQKGDGGARTVTVTLDGNTKIQVQTAEDEEVAGEGGKTKRRPKVVDGSAADLVAGKRVSVSELNGTAVSVLVLRDAPKREGGEGERGGGEPKPPKVRREGGEGERPVGEAKPPKRSREGGEGDRQGESVKPAGEDAKAGGEGAKAGGEGAKPAAGGGTWW